MVRAHRPAGEGRHLMRTDAPTQYSSPRKSSLPYEAPPDKILRTSGRPEVPPQESAGRDARNQRNPMPQQSFQIKTDSIVAAFEKMKKDEPGKISRGIDLSWSNWPFGQEPLANTAKRLARFGLKYIELHGNRYGPDL